MIRKREIALIYYKGHKGKRNDNNLSKFNMRTNDSDVLKCYLKKAEVMLLLWPTL